MPTNACIDRRCDSSSESYKNSSKSNQYQRRMKHVRRQQQQQQHNKIQQCILAAVIVLCSCSIVNAFTMFASLSSSNSDNGILNKNIPQPLQPSSGSLIGGTVTRNIATQVLQGTGEVSYQQLDKYNIEYEQSVEQWTIQKVIKINSNAPILRYDCINTKEYYVDTITNIQIPRLPSTGGGLGIVLTEIASAGVSTSNDNDKDTRQNNNIGITVVSELVENGASDIAMKQLSSLNGPSLISPGDIITSISLVRNVKKTSTTTTTNKSLSKLDEIEKVYTVSTEFLGYDATIDAIQSTIPTMNEEQYDDMYILQVKRIRRKPKVTLVLQYPPDDEVYPNMEIQYELYAGENLRQGMLLRGVQINDKYAKRFDTKNSGNCGAGGLCRTCAVSIQSGNELLNPQRIAEQQMLIKDNPRWRLACKAIVGYGMKEGTIKIRINPRQWI